MTVPAARRVSSFRVGPGQFAVVLDGEPFGPVVPEDIADAVVWWLNHGGLEYLESPPKGGPSASPLRFVGDREVAPRMYEVMMESAESGRTTRRVLVLPEWAIRGETAGEAGG